MEKIIVNVSWYGKNSEASLCDSVSGAAVLTAKTFEQLKEDIPETLRFHVEGMLEDNENIPDWLANGVYEFDYKLDTASTITKYATLATFSRVTGMKERQLSHSANGTIKPRLP